jgi:catechol 2,3-dioxygenase-like lactoylglutathione lyase family enzyme
MNLDHVTLRTADLEGTRSFLERVLDLKPGYRPAFSFPGYWLYAGGEPIVHLIPGRSSRVDRSGETIDHAGFRLEGYSKYREKLDALDMRYSTMDLPSSMKGACSFGPQRASCWSWSSGRTAAMGETRTPGGIAETIRN